MIHQLPRESHIENDPVVVGEVLAADAALTKAFNAITGSILEQEPDLIRAARRLWRAPDIATEFCFNVLTGQAHERLEGVVTELRHRVAELVANRLDRTNWQRDVGGRLSRAAQRFVLRPWREMDLEHYVTLLDNPRVWELLREDYPDPVTREIAQELIRVSNAFPERHVVRAVEIAGAPVGQMRLQFDSSKDERSAEISYWLGGGLDPVL